MATTTCVNGQTVVHETSGGVVTSFPDICNTPAGNTIIPIPYSNTAFSKDTAKGSTSVLVDGNQVMLKDAVFSKSTGSEAGTAKGVGSGTTCGEARFTNYSFDVKIEGRNVCRRLDPMVSNNGNTPPSRLMQPNVELVASKELQDKEHLLPLALAFAHPDAAKETLRQPRLKTPHTIKGPDTSRHEAKEYVGALHLCEQEGEYQINFDEFDLAESSL